MSHDLRFQRVFHAAPEDVFDAFTARRSEKIFGQDDPGWIPCRFSFE